MTEHVDAIYVPIVKRSVRHNPNAGDTCAQIPGRVTIDLRGSMTHKQWVKWKSAPSGPIVDTKHLSVHVTSVSSGLSKDWKGLKYTFTAVAASDLTTDKLLAKVRKLFGTDVVVNINYPMELVHFMTPEPSVLYRHKKISFKCPHCKSGPYKKSDLISRPRYDGEGEEIGDDLVCPSCEEAIEFHYERMTEPDLLALAEENAK